MTDWFQRIRDSLKHHGKESSVWSAGDGELLLSPHGARVLACRIPGVEGNLFWHHPDLEDSAKAAGPLTTAGGGLAGDRLWIAPEIGLSWPDLKKARVSPWSSYKTPPQMDPGDYRVLEEAAGHLRLTTEMSLTDYRGGLKFSLRVARQFNLIAPPSGLPRGVKAVSFSLRNELTLLDADAGAVTGGWDILQVPAGGVFVAPVTRRVRKPRMYYGKFDPRRLRCTPSACRFVLDGKKQMKFGLLPEETTGRMAYIRKLGKITTAIVRVFAVQPGEPYVDLPLTSDDRVGGDALQSYNDGGSFGGFGEMEYHDAGFVAGKSPVTRSGPCVTHVLAGGDRGVRKAASELVGVDV